MFNSALSRIQTSLHVSNSRQISLLVSDSQARKAAERMDQQSSGDPSPSNRNELNASVNQNRILRAQNIGSKVKTLPWRNTNLVWSFTYQSTDISTSPDETNQSQSSTTYMLICRLMRHRSLPSSTATTFVAIIQSLGLSSLQVV